MQSAVELAGEMLETTYHSPRLGNKKNPLNELLFILLSLRTTGPSFERVYRSFKRVFPKWQSVNAAPVEEVAKAMEAAGLSNQKARSLKAVLEVIERDFGCLSLGKLKSFSDEEVERYLQQLPGLGKKSARCIMLYSFGRRVFPVDAHCFRIVKRLGWVRQEAKLSDAVADEIQAIVPDRLRYSLHVNMVAHGRAVCSERHPKCRGCVLLLVCSHLGRQR